MRNKISWTTDGSLQAGLASIGRSDAASIRRMAADFCIASFHSVGPKTKREDFLVLRSAGSPEDEPIIGAIF